MVHLRVFLAYEILSKITCDELFLKIDFPHAFSVGQGDKKVDPDEPTNQAEADGPNGESGLPIMRSFDHGNPEEQEYDAVTG